MGGEGCLIISLDFELMWGGVGTWDESKYVDSNVENAKKALWDIIKLCNTYDVHITVAAVGMLMLNGKEDFEKMKPRTIPQYSNYYLSPYKEEYIDKIKDESLYFVPELIGNIVATDGVELGSHTYSHYFCWEEGQTIAQFDADLKQDIMISSRYNNVPKSLVFPRNQVTPEYLKIARKNGFFAYRGNAKSFYGKSKNFFDASVNKIGRLLDSYVNLTGHNTYSLSEVENNEGLWNIKASRFLRPYSIKYRLFEKLKVCRICKDIEYAAMHKEIYHLWWHPHNFGANLDENLNELEMILQSYKKNTIRYGMKSYTMSELAKQINDYGNR